MIDAIEIEKGAGNPSQIKQHRGVGTGMHQIVLQSLLQRFKRDVRVIETHALLIGLEQSLISQEDAGFQRQKCLCCELQYPVGMGPENDPVRVAEPEAISLERITHVLNAAQQVSMLAEHLIDEQFVTGEADRFSAVADR